jgi:hypothetical protein
MGSSSGKREKVGGDCGGEARALDTPCPVGDTEAPYGSISH